MSENSNPGMNGQSQQVQVGNSVGKPQSENLYQKKVKENFHIYGIATFLYACLYALCMYRNSSGVSYPFFVAGSLFYICFCLAKLGISWKKEGAFYAISMMLLSISTFCTDDGIFSLSSWEYFC